MLQQRKVFCGGLVAADREPDALHLDIAGSSAASKIKLKIDQLSKQLADNIPELLIDLLEVATYVYCADQLTRRDTPYMTSMGADWRRSFLFLIPVRRPEVWMRADVRSALSKSLHFLSEDEFQFDFRKTSRRVPLQHYLPFDARSARSDAPAEIVLFSGGLDSLAGAAQSSIADGKNVLLVSHQSSNMVASKQKYLAEELRRISRSNKVHHVPVIIGKGKAKAVEFTQRTRSLLFAALGLVIARMHGLSDLYFYENGVVSVNLPIVDHVLGTRASRTTHPRVLKDFSDFFSLILSQPFDVRNPFLWWTKADVIKSLAESDCEHLINHSFSCTRVREATQTQQHCGVCSQCVDRRFGILAAGLERHDKLENYAFDLLAGQHRPGDDLTLVESFVVRAQKLATMTLQGFVTTYGQLFRVAQCLPIAPEAAARQLWELHQRHGREVVAVVDQAIRQATDVNLQGSSLLALVANPLAEQPPYVDPSEITASFAESTEDIGNQETQILMGVDSVSSTVVFDDGFELDGEHFEVLSELVQAFEGDRTKGMRPDDRGFVSAETLSRKWRIEEPSVRRRVLRVRDSINARYMRERGWRLTKDEVIQNRRGRGYRLNPSVALVDPSILRTEGC